MAVRAALWLIISVSGTFLPMASAAPADIIHAHYAATTETVAQSTNRLVSGIISYARWPDGRTASNQNICVIGAPRFTTALDLWTVGGDAPRTTARTTSDLLGGADCDAIYIGRMPATERRQIIAWVRSRPVLTITDDDPACTFGAMFCLVRRTNNLGFSINLDAISRSHLRVDPRVLRIGSEGNG